MTFIRDIVASKFAATTTTALSYSEMGIDLYPRKYQARDSTKLVRPILLLAKEKK